MMLTAVTDIQTVRYAREPFPGSFSPQFERLFDAHGREVRGKPFNLDFKRYHQIEFEGRLVWIVARSIETNAPIGYACSFWYRDLHYDERVAADDLWYVKRDHRMSGIGKTLKIMCHAELARQGVTRIYDSIRATFRHGTLMSDLGFEVWGVRWMKDLRPLCDEK